MEALNQMNYDAFVLGKNEIAFGNDIVRTMTGVASFPIISWNSINADNPLRPFLIKDVKGLKVGITGLLPDNTSSFEKAGMKMVAPKEALAEIKTKLTKKVDLIVLFSHLGYDETVELIGEDSDIDIAVVEQMTNWWEGKRIGKTFFASCGLKGELLGIIDVKFDGKSRKTISIQQQLQPLGEEFAYDLEMLELIRTFKSDLKEYSDLMYAKEKEAAKKAAIQSIVEKTMQMTPEEFFQFQKNKLSKENK